MVVLPPVNRTGVELKPPMVTATEPVGAGSPLAPPTATRTVSDCDVLMLNAEGVTVTVAG